jgi:hypothetical protein
MKNILASMAAISALSVAAPAAAQYSGASQYGDRASQYGNYPAGNSADGQIGDLQARLDAGVRQGSIDPREAAALRQQLNQLMQTERQYSMGGLSAEERADLQLRVDNFDQQIRYAGGGRGDGYDRNDGYDRDGQYDPSDRFGRNDGDDRGDGYDRSDDGDQYGDDGYDQNGGYDARGDDRYRRDGGRIDDNRDGWDDRDSNRDGRLDDGSYYGRGQGTYDQGAYNRGGIGGAIGDLLGIGGLRVGQRDPGNLQGVPYQYQGRYRDGNGSYYRSDGRAIYQMDTRTNAVVRIFPMSR